MTPGQARDLRSEKGMNRQLQAVTDLLALRSGLADMFAAGLPVGTYLKYVPAWTAMTMSYPQGWSGLVNGEDAYPVSTLDHLRTLAGWFQAAGPSPSADAQGELRDFLIDVLALLEDDATISAELKVYLGRLVREMQNALDDEEVFDRFDFDEAGRRLWTALFAAAAQSQDEEKEAAWRGMANKLWWPTAAGVLGSAPSIITGVLSASGHS
jgi:hypothetical protein